MGGPVRDPPVARPVRARDAAAHALLRHDARAVRRDRGVDSAVGGDEPERQVAGADHDRRRARVALRGRARAPHRGVPGDRRRRRVRRHVGGARARPAQAARLHPRRGERADPQPHDLGDARPHGDRGRGVGRAGVRDGGLHAVRRRSPHDLRQLHRDRAARARRPRVLRQGRRRRVRGGRPAPARRD